MTSSICVFIYNRVVLRISGRDRVSFLQGLISNDLEKLTPDRALYSLLLTPQGRFQDDFFIVEHEGALLLTPEKDEVEALKNRLELYKLRSEVKIELLENWALGAHPASSYLQRGTVIQRNSYIEFVDPRLSAMGTLVLGPVLFDSGLEFNLYDIHRLSLGVPDGGRDMLRGKAIPLENSMDQLDAIDWDKGCYLGQELTARTKYSGEIRKSLWRVLKLAGPMPYFDEPLFFGDKEVGRMRSSCGLQGLALLRSAELSYDMEITSKDGGVLKIYPPA
jgi:folate-binding protein YgfZ